MDIALKMSKNKKKYINCPFFDDQEKRRFLKKILLISQKTLSRNYGIS